MALTTAIAIYFLIWWLTLFAVLPWGVTSQYEEGAPGTDPGAPRVHNVAAQAALDHACCHRDLCGAGVSVRLSAGHARRSRGLDGLPGGPKKMSRANALLGITEFRSLAPETRYDPRGIGAVGALWIFRP